MDAARDFTCLASDLARHVSAISVSRAQLLMRRNIDGLGALGCAPRMLMFCATLVRRTLCPIVGVTGLGSRALTARFFT